MIHQRLKQKVELPLSRVGFIKNNRQLSRYQLLAFVVAFAAVGTYVILSSFAISPNVTIDYSSEKALDPHAFGMVETGYQTPNVLANDSLEVQRFKALGTNYMRNHLVYSTSGNPSSQIVCGGGGCDTGPTGDQWITATKQTGADPVVICQTNSPTDCSNLVKHFNVNPSTGQVDPTLPNYVKWWLIGNEPDLNGYSSTVYANDFNADYDAMKAVDPNIKIGGPTKAWYDSTWIGQFLQISGSRVDFLDFHGYPSNPNYTFADLFNWAAGTGNSIANARALLAQYAPSKAATMPIEVGEWSLDSGNLYATYGPNGRNLAKSNFNVVWGADVIGNIIENGGISMHYGTKGNVVAWSTGTRVDYDTGQSINLNLDDPQAPYHAYGMFTGEGLFRGYGNVEAKSTTTLPNVDVFASDNPKNIVAVNKDTAATQTAVFQLNGITSGTVDVWQHNQSTSWYKPPVHLGTINFSGGLFSYDLPPLSATTFVVTPGSTTTAPTVTLTASPTTITSGQSSSLTWSSTNATSCTASGGWSGTQSASGTNNVSPTSTATYTITCTGAGGSVTANATVSVTTTAPAPPTVSLKANPLTITSGQSSSLTWSSTNATSCTASGGWSGTQSASGTHPVSPTSTTTYNLTCTGTGGTTNATTTVTVGIATPPPPPPPTSGTIVAQDTFQRANQSHWGTASDGLTWSGDANTAEQFKIVNNSAQVTSTSNSSNAILGPSLANAQVLFTGSMSSTNYANIGAVLRWHDTNNWYKAYLNGNNLVIQKKVSGSTSTLRSVSFHASANTNYSLRFQVVGSTLSAKAWSSDTTEPTSWTSTVTDYTFTSGQVGLRMLPQGGTITYYSFTAFAL